MTAAAFRIRPIEPGDNIAVAAIIRTVMTEMGASGEGFAIHDPEVDDMAGAYAGPRAGFYVLQPDDGGPLVGIAGFGPLEGDTTGEVCELRKMYFLPGVRGRGQGAQMLRHVLRAAKAAGYTTCYLETLESMVAARKLYERFGFTPLPGPLGCTGHYSCDSWYTLTLAMWQDEANTPT